MAENKDIQLPSNINKDIIQSYRFTMARCKWTAPEKRIIIRLTEMAQCEIKGLKIKDNLCQIVPNKLLQLKEVTMPLNAIFPEGIEIGGTQYEDAKKSFKSLAKKGMEYENKDTKFWQYTAIINKPKIYKHHGTWYASFSVCDEIWYCLVDFSSGYRKFEMLTAMSFDSIYSMRMYEIVSGQKKPLVLTLKTIIDTFKLTKSMSTPQHIEDKVLKRAKKDLDAKAPYSFKFERNEVKSRGRGGKKVTGYTLYPYYIAKNRNNALEIKDLAAKLPSGGAYGGAIDTEIYLYLTKVIGWPKESLNSNKALFIKAQETLPHYKDDVHTWAGQSRAANNPIGCFISLMKKAVKEQESLKEKKEVEKTTEPVQKVEEKRSIQGYADLFANQYDINKK